MSIESLDQFVNHCAACEYLSHRVYKYKELAWCDKWNKKIEDFLDTCFHFKRNPNLPPVDAYYKPKSIKKRIKKQILLEETSSLFFGNETEKE